MINGTTAYTWDGNGNLLTSKNTVNTANNKTYTYNLLNLPKTVAVPGGSDTYTYDANGTKLRKAYLLSGTTITTDYISGIEYDNSTTAIGFIQTEEGRAVPNTATSYDYEYYLGDQLGNTRITFGTKTGAAVSYQVDDYYPFGMEILSPSPVPNLKNQYLYNKKELQGELGQYDYGARFYDPVIARWNVVDAYAEHPNQINFSPYIYVGNNPIDKTDPDGNCQPCDVPSERDLTGNSGNIVENAIGAAEDAVTSGVFTLASFVKSGVQLAVGIPAAAPVEYSFDYSSGQRTMVSSPITSPLGAVSAFGNATLGVSNAVPIDGPATGIFAKAGGVRSSAVTVVKSLEDQAKELVHGLNGGKNSITIGTVDKQIRFDLAGKPHLGVPTPHLQSYNKNFFNGKVRNISKAYKHAVPMTQRELRAVRKFLKKIT